jgi:hypothetical protein
MQTWGEHSRRGRSKCEGPAAGIGLVCRLATVHKTVALASCVTHLKLPLGQGRRSLLSLLTWALLGPTWMPSFTLAGLANGHRAPLPWLAAWNPALALENALEFTRLIAHSNPCWGFGQHTISRWARVTIYFIFKNSFYWVLSYYKSNIYSL